MSEFADLDERALQILRGNVDILITLDDIKLIMVALAEVVLVSDIPLVRRLSLHSALLHRAGVGI